jgi:hypothetical protein
LGCVSWLTTHWFRFHREGRVIAFNAGVIALVQPLPLDAASRHLHLPAALDAHPYAVRAARHPWRAGPARGRRPARALYAAYLGLAVSGVAP